MPEAAPIDRYVVMEYLAEGGMGAIYLGKKLGAGGFEKQVVLKQLLPEFTQQPEFIDLFLREARLSATLDHANIIHTIDLVTAGDEHFIVMEYLDGADLRTLLKKSKERNRNVSPAAAIYIAKELLSALAYAHNKHGPDGKHLRLIHRDISPSNILISANGEVKLTDFGIAKAATHNSVFYRVKGKVGYMSPEQARSDAVDARSDLYSMAVCLFEIITGERLHVSAGITTSPEEMYGKPIPLISKKVPGMPPELDKVMLRALSIDPIHRYQSAAEFQDALLRCAHRHGLMMSAPELATHLVAVCGPPETWRQEGREDSAGGTELYEWADEGTEQLDVADAGLELGDDDFLAVGGAIVDRSEKRRERARTSLTLLGDLQGMELTSMQALADVSMEGARPLVELAGPPPAKTPPVQRQRMMPRMESEYTGVVIVQGTGRDDNATRSDPRDEGADPGSKGKGATPKPRKHSDLGRHLVFLFFFALIVAGATAAAIALTGPQIDLSSPSGNERPNT